jgi:adenylate kinase family enzyme
MNLDRVAIIGLSGAGKTTLGRRLSGAWGQPLWELDELWWGAGWQRVNTAVLRTTLTPLLEQPRWITDNQHTAVNDLILGRATSVIWLDYPPQHCFPRTLRRLWQDWRTQRLICHGNQLNRHAILPLLHWTIEIRRTEPRDFTPLLAQYPHLHVIRLTNAVETLHCNVSTS